MSYKDYFTYGTGFYDVGYLQTIVGIVTDLYEELGCRFDHRRHAVVASSEHPSFYASDGRIEISAIRCSYWCKVIYQTAHEITHLFMEAHDKSDGTNHLSWVEEIVCEAATLWFLGYFAKGWSFLGKAGALARKNLGYKSAIVEYLRDCLSDYESDARGRRTISDFTTESELRRHEERSTEEREVHSREVLILYRTLTARNLATLIRYRDFTRPGTLLLDPAYFDAYPNDSVRALLSFQRNIR